MEGAGSVYSYTHSTSFIPTMYGLGPQLLEAVSMRVEILRSVARAEWPCAQISFAGGVV